MAIHLETYYFSTSCGYTTDGNDSGERDLKDVPYLCREFNEDKKMGGHDKEE